MNNNNNGGSQDYASEELVTEVKLLQRQDPNAKAQWVQYTDTYAAGKRDPAKQTGEFLRQFIQAYQSGTLPPCNPDNVVQEGSQLPSCTKHLQRKYPSFKQVWASYCAQFGNGFNDPMRHDVEYHARFYNWMSQQAGMNMGLPPHPVGGHMVSSGGPMGGCGGMGNSMNSMGGGSHGFGGKGGMNMMGGGPGHGSMHPNSGAMYGGPPQKRMRTDNDAGGWSAGSGDPRKDTLVHSLKAYKRQGEEYKNLWGMYADTYLNGVRDPARHTTETLQEFITNHHVPILSPAQTGMMRANNMSAPGPRNTHPPITDQQDPVKAQLVQVIKDYQKQGQEAKDTWAAFAGLTRDPARHEIGLLKEFATLHGL